MEYEHMSRKELMQLRANIDKAIATVGDRDKRNALKAAEDAAREHGFTLAELMPLMGQVRGRRSSKTQPDLGTGGAPRYRNPDNPDQTWSGRGRRPRWVHEAEAAGRPLSELVAV